MIEDLKVLLGETATNYTEPHLRLILKLSVSEVESYCNRKLDTELELVALQIAKLKLVRSNSEGLAAQSYSGVSENYIDGYPAEIKAVLNRKRKVKLL